jgi:ribonuclease P protein component
VTHSGDAAALHHTEDAASSKVRRQPARVQRLRKPEQFAALSADRSAWRQCLQWICVAARFTPPVVLESGEPGAAPPGPAGAESVAGLRVGFTVAKRQVKRSVMRAMVKRVMREAMRAAAPGLTERTRGRGMDLVMRLRNPLPDPDTMALAAVKRSLRAESDTLLLRLAKHLEKAGMEAGGASSEWQGRDRQGQDSKQGRDRSGPDRVMARRDAGRR